MSKILQALQKQAENTKHWDQELKDAAMAEIPLFELIEYVEKQELRIEALDNVRKAAERQDKTSARLKYALYKLRELEAVEGLQLNPERLSSRIE